MLIVTQGWQTRKCRVSCLKPNTVDHQLSLRKARGGSNGPVTACRAVGCDPPSLQAASPSRLFPNSHPLLLSPTLSRMPAGTPGPSASHSPTWSLLWRGKALVWPVLRPFLCTVSQAGPWPLP